MAINSYFYDSTVEDPRTYSAADFARAFDIALETGCLIREAFGGTFGFDIGGTNNTTIYAGAAIIEGHFVEITGTETLTVPTGSYSGQVVIHCDFEDTRVASLLVKQDRSPIKTASVYELELYDVTVENGIITAAADKRFQGGAIPNNHNQPISTIDGLQAHIDKAITWTADPNGIKANMGKYNNTGKPVVLFLTSSRPSAVSTEHRVWIQIDNF
jgi:hypothetical protein